MMQYFDLLIFHSGREILLMEFLKYSHKTQ